MAGRHFGAPLPSVSLNPKVRTFCRGCAVLAAQVDNLDAIVVPVSGGGMISGVATAAKALRPDIKVIAAEPTGSCAALAHVDTAAAAVCVL